MSARTRRVLLAALGALGCSSEPAPSPAENEPAPATVSAELGIPGGTDGLDFVPLEGGEELRLKTFGQGGTHVYLGARCENFGNRAFVTFTLENLRTGARIVSPAPWRPQLLYCGEAEPTHCDLVPATVLTSGLFQLDEERDGLPVRVGLEVSDDGETGLSATDSSDVVLSTADL